MENKYQELFTPLKVGGVTIKNRFVHAPMEGTAPIEWMTGYKFNEHTKRYLLESVFKKLSFVLLTIFDKFTKNRKLRYPFL